MRLPSTIFHPHGHTGWESRYLLSIFPDILSLPHLTCSVDKVVVVFFFAGGRAACGILVHQLGIEPMCPAVEA